MASNLLLYFCSNNLVKSAPQIDETLEKGLEACDPVIRENKGGWRRNVSGFRVSRTMQERFVVKARLSVAGQWSAAIGGKVPMELQDGWKTLEVFTQQATVHN